VTQARLVEVDVPGLNLLLGGGVPVLKRHPDSDESAVLLVRGPPGSGKTVLGTQLAGAMARALVPGQMTDVAYGCVELLPVELAAQHAGLTRPEVHERVITPSFPVDAPEWPTAGECRIYADLLALQPGEEQVGIEAAVERLLDLTERAGGRPRVVVIDSLSDGYDLGSRAPRILADALCKLAVARGMVFILLEETIDGRPSNWSFAADVVMELWQPTEQGPGMRARTINITKNRFGRAEPGPHRADIGGATAITSGRSRPPISPA
jgi:KaiC/GvpD/RAD55 family RecA-like ATPase